MNIYIYMLTRIYVYMYICIHVICMHVRRLTIKGCPKTIRAQGAME